MADMSSVASTTPLPADPPADLSIIRSRDDHHTVPQRYLALLADVAERLLAADGPASMVDELFELIHRELRLDVFFNYRIDGERLFLEAHGGMSDAEASNGAVLQMGQAVCGCVARDRKAVHAIGVQSSEDPLHAFVKDLGLDAYACTPLVHGNRLLGTLGFGRRWADRFTPDELSFLHTVCHYVALAKYRLLVEQALRDGVETRERLLAELNHRVRHALQVAVGLVSAECAGADDAAQAPLQRAVERLQVLALAHRPLYAEDTPSAIDIGKLIVGIAEGTGGDVTIGTLANAPPVAIETAAAMALLIHTLVSVRAQPITLHADIDAGALRLRFEGLRSLPDDAPPADRRLATALLHQLRGRVATDAEGLTLYVPYAVHD